MRKIIIAMGSFKGSLSSSKVLEAVSRGFTSVFPKLKVINISVSEGGEGLVNSLVKVNNDDIIEVIVKEPVNKLQK
jgi:glycerate kinase